MQKSDVKSSTVAGILGVFLGAFGGHDWYLGNTKKAITHVSLCVGGLILLMIGIILDNLSKSIPVLNMLFICVIIMAYVIIVGNAVWGMIEGIMLLAQGDAALAAKGYKVADSGAPMTMANPNENPNNANATTAPVTTTIASMGSDAGKVEMAKSTPSDVAPVAGKDATVVNNAAAGAGANVGQTGSAAPVAAAEKTEGMNGGVSAEAGKTGTASGTLTGAGAVSASSVTTEKTENAPGVQPDGAVAAGTGNAATSFPAGAPAQPTTAVNDTPQTEESDAKIVERSTSPQQPTDEEVAKAAQQAVSQASQMMDNKQ